MEFYDEVGIKSFHCEMCSQIFVRESNLDIHISKFHNSGVPFQCESCNSTFTYLLRFKEHKMLVHEGKQLFKCKLCNHFFQQKINLKKHTWVVHENKRPFRCGICSLSFGQRVHVKRHYEKYHNGEQVIDYEENEKELDNHSLEENLEKSKGHFPSDNGHSTKKNNLRTLFEC